MSSLTPRGSASQHGGAQHGASQHDGARSRKAAVAPRKGRWSHKDLRQLEATYGTRDDATVARTLGRPVSSIRERARAIFSVKPSRQGKPWTPEDDRRLKQCLGIASSSGLALILRRSEAEIEARLSELFNSIQGGPWTTQEIRMLKSMFGRREDRVLSVVLSHTIAEVQERARQLRLAKDKAFLSRLAEKHERTARLDPSTDGQDHDGREPVKAVVPVPKRTRMKRWTDDEVGTLRSRYPHEFNVNLAETLDKSAKAIMSKANSLGLKKTPELLALMGKKNVRVRYDGRGSRDGRAK